VPINKATTDKWRDHVDISEDDDCESIHSYREVPPYDRDVESIFKPPDALEEDSLTSVRRTILDRRDAHVPTFLSDFVQELRADTMVALPLGRALAD
jgi:hypothetical protein